MVQSERLDIARVWSAHPVDFELKTVGNYQYVGYYDSLRRMTIARRTLGSSQWQRTLIPQTTGWDSHNSINLAFDDSGYIHLSGNMHHAPLVYYRSTQPNSISAFSAPGMVGSNENSVTYPVFITGPKREFVFQYRDGGSGNGNTIWNVYNLATKKWSRLSDAGLFNGGGEANAYPFGPFLRPDGYYHMVWLWRETTSANTCHDLSHIKSRDLVNWETMAGVRVALPVTKSTAGVVIDPVQTGKGLTNMDVGVAWDNQDRPVVTYHKYLIQGRDTTSQIYNARWENGSWKIRQASNWTGYKMPLDAAGSLTHFVYALPISIDKAGRIVQYYHYRDKPKGQWVLDEGTLKPLSDSAWRIPESMREFYTIESTWSGSPAMQLNQKQEGEYYLRWETLPPNGDDPRDPPYPPFSMLRVYRFTDNASTGIAETFSPRPGNQGGRWVGEGLLTRGSREGMPGSVRIYSLDGRLRARTPLLH